MIYIYIYIYKYATIRVRVPCQWFCVNKETDRPNWPPASTKGKIKDNHIHVREIVQDKKLGFFVFKPYAEVVESRVVKDKAKSYIEIQDLRSIVKVGEMMQAY